MINTVSFSTESRGLLQARQLSDEEITDFATLIQQMKQSENNAKQHLNSLSPQELELLRKANSLADPIMASQVSEEGAMNLFRQPDNSDSVDLNNDGIVEVGVARNVQFPPANAPQWVSDAWEEATKGMTWADRATAELHLHSAIYGINIDGVSSKTPLSPGEQWSEAGIKRLFKDLHGSLEFAVSLDGWTPQHKARLALYERFESALSASAPSAFNLSQSAQSSFGNHSVAEAQEPAKEAEHTTSKENEKIRELNTLLLYARLGIDKQKLDKIAEKMAEVENDPTLSKAQKYKKLQALEQQRLEIIEEAQRRTMEQEKRKALLGDLAVTDERLKEQSLKSLLGR
ncbi:hypothetical protein DRW07_03495 [Alteromonas sediminis]|uniref:Uncharacterized protein n=1 Tax=Alteromonas sediminis TaxID=2259342 RepID=A0A3N5Y3I6_9ALTE|nr:hypothetical protein [Alteromonas sediminis]RPJ68482.1 hypothetical protein DRW07_03495 [Alteromonas sediminis]